MYLLTATLSLALLSTAAAQGESARSDRNFECRSFACKVKL